MFSRKDTSTCWMKSPHMDTCSGWITLPLWRFPLFYGEYFQQGSWKQNLFAFLQPSFNFLLPVVSLGIFPQYFILFLLPPSEKRLSLKFIFSRTGTHARPEDNRPTYLSGSFIYLFFLLPSTFSPWLWIDHGRSKMTAVSCALAMQMNLKKKKWSFGVLGHRSAVWAET